MSKKFTYADAIRQAISEEMDANSDVFMIGEDVGESGGVFGVSQGLWEKHGAHQMWDTPISEEAIVGAAVGAAMMGARPIAEIMFSDFSMLAMDMIVNQAAKLHYMTGGQLSMPLVIRMVTGEGGSTSAQHSQSLEAMFTQVPGLKVVAPSTPEEAKGLLRQAIQDPDPVIFFEHKLLYGSSGGSTGETVPDEPMRFGKGRIRREGSDVTIVSYLRTLNHTLKAAEKLAEDGISAEVWDPRTLVPFDHDGLSASIKKTGRLVIAHEAPIRGGFGAEIAAWAAGECFDDLKAPVVRIGAQNSPIPYSPVLEDAVLPRPASIEQTVRNFMHQHG